MNLDHTLERMVRKFALHTQLDAADRQALRDLPFRIRKVEPGEVIVHEGAVTNHSALLLAGFAVRHKLTADGDRQIVSVHVPGDFVDLEASLLAVVDYNVQTLTRAEIAMIERRHLAELAESHPRLGRAMWIDTLADAALYREWLVNVGRRPAIRRIGHLLCELARRLERAGLGTARGYQLPMTQEQLADAVGLTPVHVNRTLKAMEAERLIRRHKRFVEIPDWERLRTISGFSELYLHLDQAA